MTAIHFKSKASYGRWLSYGHKHKLFEKTKGNQTVYVAGKKVQVKH